MTHWIWSLLTIAWLAMIYTKLDAIHRDLTKKEEQ